MQFTEGEEVWAYVEYVDTWVRGTFMFYYNVFSAYVRLEKLIIPIIEGKMYTSEPTVPVDKIKRVSVA